MTIKQYGGVFGRNPTFNDVTIEGQLTFDGDIDINSDLKVSGDIETTGNVIIATSGQGIDFSATSGTGTSELLDDYEEGVFTPTISSGVTSPTYTTNLGSYTKVGNKVYFEIAMNLATGSASGSIFIFSGLPFAGVASPNGGAFATYNGGFITTGDIVFYVNGSTVECYKNDGNAFNGTDASNHLSTINIAGFYTTTS